MKFDRKDPKTQRLLTGMTVVLVILVGTISSLLRSDQESSAYLTFYNEGYLSIKDESGNTTDVYYKDMLSVEYVESPDFGEADGGSTVGDIRLGQWNSKQFGSYLNCTEVDLDSCVWIQTQSGSYVINYESDSTTQTLCQAILKAREKLTQ